MMGFHKLLDPNALNYDPLANTDDGSCTYCYAVADIGSDTIVACDSVVISTNPITNGSYVWSTSSASTSGNLALLIFSEILFLIKGTSVSKSILKNSLFF